MRYLIVILNIFLTSQIIAQPFEFLNYTEQEPNMHKCRKGFQDTLLNEIELPKTIFKSTTENDKHSPIVRKADIADRKNVNYSLDVGMQIGTSFNDFYYSNNYISPKVSYSLNSKFTLIAGIGYSFSRLDNLSFVNSDLEMGTTSINVHSLSAFSILAYELNPKTSIYTTVLVEQSSISSSSIPNFNKTFAEGSLGVNYKVTPNFSFNAQVSYGNRPYYNNSFSPNGFQLSPGVGF